MNTNSGSSREFELEITRGEGMKRRIKNPVVSRGRVIENEIFTSGDGSGDDEGMAAIRRRIGEQREGRKKEAPFFLSFRGSPTGIEPVRRSLRAL